MFKTSPLVFLPLALLFLLTSCGKQKNFDSPVSPQLAQGDSLSGPQIPPPDTLDSREGHLLWGYYLFFYDPGVNSADVIPIRNAGTHWNALKWLEQGPCTDCVSIEGITPNPSGTKSIDIKIRHPFTSPNLTGFDVRGIAMFNGSHVFPVSGLNMPDRTLGDGELVNADGYTTLYNVTTAGSGPGGLQGYIKGKFATITAPGAKLNGFKRHITADISNVRNAFFANDEVTVTYEIMMPTSAFVFGYAVDASWASPINKPVDDPMTDFPPEANCPEPWRIDTGLTPIGPGLNTTGGEVQLSVGVYDFGGQATHGTPIVECPELFDGAKTATWAYGGPGFSLWEVVIGNENMAPAGDYGCLIKVVDDENSGSPWYLDLTAYQIVTLTVSGDGDLIWAKRAGGGQDDYGYAITTLSDNSTVVTGSFAFGESATFGQGEPNQTVLDSAGDDDVFIARYNPDGTLAWAKRAGGTITDIGSAITTLSDNSTLVTGCFWASATFGQGEPNQTVLDSAGISDIFIARFNPDGTLAWAKRAGGTAEEEGLGITSLSDNSTVVTGYFNVSATFGPGEPNETVLSAGYDDIFIARYNADGTLAWAKSAGGSQWDIGEAITALSDDSTVVTGYFWGSATFGQGEPNQTMLVSAGQQDIFIAKYNADGTLAWAKSAGGWLGNEYGYAITALCDNAAVVTGSFQALATFGQGEPNETELTGAADGSVFIARYNPDGTLAWAKRAGGANSMGRAITALSDNSTVVTGSFFGPGTFGPGEPNETLLNADGYSDIFVARYNPDGTLSWAKRAGGPDASVTTTDEGIGITALSDDSTVVTGSFPITATFGPGEPNETELVSAGNYDIFIARFTE
jgi:uncharacterized delta-60 repeat protein